MLDSEAKLDEEQAEPVTETEEVPEEVQAEAEPEEIVVAIEGEEPEADEDTEVEAELGDAGRNALRKAREAAKAARAEARELKARLAAQQVQQVQQPELKRPTLEECGFNEDAFAERLAEYVAAKKEADAKRAEAEAQEKARIAEYNAKLARYNQQRARVGIDDDAQAKVVDALSPQQQTALMDAASDPARVVAALAKTPKVLSELAGIKEIHKFTYRLAQIEGKITVTTKTPPPPESKLRGAIASPTGSLQSQLEAAEKRAAITGDRTEVLRIKRMMQAKG